MRTRLIFILILTTLLAITSNAGAADSLHPQGWDAGVRLREPVDLNPDPKILEINLEARVADVEIEPGRRIQAWTYDGGLPGPLIRLNVGDRLIVHFTNQLPSPTTVHWHGIRVPIAMDGVPGVSQPEVVTGGSFTYDFIVPDAGLFWYHPHVLSAQQVGFGLYGALLVQDPTENVGVTDETTLVLSDIGIGENGKLESPDAGGTTGMAFGREGNIPLVNGKRNPQLLIRSGAPQRWRVVNTSKARYFNIDLGKGNTFTKIGGDGGLQEYAVEENALVLAPGERADVIVHPRGKPGSEYIITTNFYDRGYGSDFLPLENLLRLKFSKDAEYRGPALPKTHRAIEPIPSANATPVSVNLYLAQDSRDGSFEYRINGKPSWNATPIPAKVGETQIWTVDNPTPWSHPIHLHGFFFQVLDKNGVPVRPLAWKDTVDVPFKQTVKLLVRFDDREGNWMVHCHILDHAEGGLMTTVQVGDAPQGEHSHMKH